MNKKTYLHRSFEPWVDLNDKKILITGGTGSFGQKFVATALERWTPAKLIVYSRDELKQYEMSRRFSPQRYGCMRYFIGDVRDVDRLEMALRDVDYVVHTAALKQVPIAEYNPIECIHTNVLGAENVVRASLRAGVEKIVTVSSDKAVNPVNLYGASKLAADKIFVAANNLSGNLPTSFSVVRYGNVLGSRGSAIPLFRRCAMEGANSLPITDPRMTRFWITLEQGVNLVLSALAQMQGGEIFVPKIPSMKLVDLAETIAPTVPHEYIGIRPGEKLHEVLITADESRVTLELPDRYVIEPPLGGFDPAPYRAQGGTRVADEFCYASNNNSEWLKPDELNELLSLDAISETDQGLH